jgi:hypothetical protein
MRIVIIVALFLSGCGLTPTQQKWATIGAGVLITGAIVAHEMDSGKAAQPETDKGAFHPCPSGNTLSCK